MRYGRLLAAVFAGFAAPAAHADWYVAETPHFVVYADQAPEKLRLYAQQLEKFDKALRLSRNVPDGPVGDANRVFVYVVSDVGRVSKLAGDSSVAGFYEARAGDSVAFVPHETGSDRDDPLALKPRQVLQHEYAHYFMFTAWPDAAFPSWVVEGWAEFNATAVTNKDGSMLFGSAPMYRAYGLLTGNPLPIQRLLAGAAGKLSEDEREALYGRGWALIHYLTFAKSRQGQFAAYVDAISRQGKTPEAAAAVFGDPKALNRELDRYITARSMSGFTVKAAELEVPPVKITKLSEGHAAVMPVRIRSESGVDEKTAPAVYAEARKIAARYPADAWVQRELAEAAFDAKDYSAALAAADKAIAADPGMVDALCYRARAMIEIAATNKDLKPETIKDLRHTIVKANKLDPDDPRPLMLYYDSFSRLGDAPSRNAKDGLVRAFELAPQDRDLRLQTANMLIADGKLARAREILLVLVFDPHAAGQNTTVTKMIADIDAKLAATSSKIPAAADAPAAKTE